MPPATQTVDQDKLSLQQPRDRSPVTRRQHTGGLHGRQGGVKERRKERDREKTLFWSQNSQFMEQRKRKQMLHVIVQTSALSVGSLIDLVLLSSCYPPSLPHHLHLPSLLWK